ncbi:MAG: hypothetical protein ACRDRG_10280 [Pseudonocardiaceae bacterium]
MSQSTTTSPSASTTSSRPAKFVGLAWSSLILGIVGVVFSPLPFVNNVSALIAVVGIILAAIAVFGSQKVLAGIGAALCVLAVVFTMAVQRQTVAELDKAFGNDPAAMSDVSASDCSVVSEYGFTSTRATVRIVNPTDKPQSYSATVSVNDASGARVGEINVFSNSLGAGQTVTLSDMNASGTAASNAKPGPATCTVANVTRFPN